MKKGRLILSLVGLVLVIFGTVLLGSLAVGLQPSLSLIQGNAFHADFAPDSATINQGQSVTFSITNLSPYNSYDSASQINFCDWKIDGILVQSTGSLDFTYIGTVVGTHNLVVDLSFMYDNWQYSDTLIGYSTITVLGNSATTTPHPTVNPTPTPTLYPTASPTPIGQTPHPTVTPTIAPIIPIPKDPTELTLMIALGVLMEAGGVLFLLIAVKRF